jgi:menaquinol-cytochrome c reductase iron-sulfur subunit
MADSHEVQRRDFVNIVLVGLGSVIGLIIGVPAIAYLLSPAVKVHEEEAWIPLGPLDAYPVDTPTQFSYTRTKVNGWEKTVNSYGAYVWRKGDGEADVIVYSNMCTHLSCRVTWQEDRSIYFCPCHDGRFNKEGQVEAGPPPGPLHTFETKVEEGVLSIRHTEF